MDQKTAVVICKTCGLFTEVLFKGFTVNYFVQIKLLQYFFNVLYINQIRQFVYSRLFNLSFDFSLKLVQHVKSVRGTNWQAILLGSVYKASCTRKERHFEKGPIGARTCALSFTVLALSPTNPVAPQNYLCQCLKVRCNFNENDFPFRALIGKKDIKLSSMNKIPSVFCLLN